MVSGVFQTGRKLDELAPGEIAWLILDSISDHWFYGESPQDIFFPIIGSVHLSIDTGNLFLVEMVPTGSVQT